MAETTQYKAVSIAPGFDADATALEAEGKWVDGDKVRFHHGSPETIGGWQKFIDSQLTGVCRGLLAWESNNGIRHIALGTDKKLYIITGGALSDITPLRDSGNLTNPFDTTSGSGIVQVTDVAHGGVQGSTVIFSGASAVGGITIDGAYLIVEVIDADTYTIQHGSAATSTANGGGTVAYQYEINIGQESATFSFGYGAGTYGTSTYGTPRSTSTVTLFPRVWWFDTWGEDLIASYNGGTIFTWDTSTGVGTRAAVIANAPDNVYGGILVNPESRHLIAFGASFVAGEERTTIVWSDSEDFTTWTPAAVNSAGEKVIAGGTRIKAAVRGTGEMFVLTESSIYSFYYADPRLIFGLQRRGDITGVVSTRGAIMFNDVVYWFAPDAFYKFDGRVTPLNSTVSDHVFNDINLVQLDKVFTSTNLEFGEVTWFYPSANSDEIDRYVTYNTLQDIWYYGTFDRTSWIERGVYHYPIATDSDGNVYYQEIGTQGDGAAIGDFVVSAFSDMEDGDVFAFVDRIIPDFTFEGTPSITLTLRFRNYPSSTVTTKGPYTVTNLTKKIDTRVRARQVSIRIDGGTDCKWELGSLRLSQKDDGRR